MSSGRRVCDRWDSGEDILMWSSVVAGEMVSMVGGLQRCLHMHGESGEDSCRLWEGSSARERQRLCSVHVARSRGMPKLGSQ